jgi:ParB family chromosome partitioning protein
MASNQDIANANKLGYVGRTPLTKRNSDSWFTPPEYLDSAHKVLGGITLDPFSDLKANEIVRAEFFFDEKMDGLTQPWKKSDNTTVFMNPPYSADMVKKCCERFIEAWNQKEIKAGIILVNNATETRWFQHLLSKANSICFTNHRISFWNADGKVVSNNTRGQAFFYFGSVANQFTEHFRAHGFCQVLNND